MNPSSLRFLQRAAVFAATAAPIAAFLMLIGAQPLRATSEDSGIASDSIVAFVNVNVVPMDRERILEGQTVIVRGGRIVEVGPAASVTVPAGALRIDGTGKYLMPGLAEMHGHIPSVERMRYTENVLFLYVANGVTTVRGMLGQEGQLALREKTKTGEIVGPTLYLAGPSFNGRSINSPQEAVAKVRQQKTEGWNLLKVHPGLTRDEYDAMARTAQEVGIRFGGHVPSDVGFRHALEMGQETFDHLDGYIAYMKADSTPVERAKLDEVVRMTRDAGAWVVPTMALWETVIGAADLDQMRRYPELKYMPRQMVNNWGTRTARRIEQVQGSNRQHAENRMQLLKALNDGGARILMGTDAPQMFSVPGFSIHREMQKMAQAGMGPYEIIRSGSVNVGEYFKNQDTFGMIAPGHRADMILVNANPLDDVANIAKRSGVMVRGRWLPESEIQERLAQIAASYTADN